MARILPELGAKTIACLSFMDYQLWFTHTDVWHSLEPKIDRRPKRLSLKQHVKFSALRNREKFTCLAHAVPLSLVCHS